MRRSLLCVLSQQHVLTNAPLMTVIREEMVALTTGCNFDRQVVTKCLPFLRPYEVGYAFVPIAERTATPGGFPITPSHSHNHAIFTRFYTYSDRTLLATIPSIHRNGFSQVLNCRGLIRLGLHPFSPTSKYLCAHAQFIGLVLRLDISQG